MKVDDYRFVPEFVSSVVDPVAPVDDDLSANVELILDDVSHFGLCAL